MSRPLTPKQQRFVEEYLIDQNGTQAATRAGYSAKTANEQASRLLANVSVASQLAGRQAKIATKADFTVVSHMEELSRLRDLAISARQVGAAIQAESLRGKCAGFYTERVDLSVSGRLTYEQLLAGTYEPQNPRLENLKVTAGANGNGNGTKGG